MLRPDEELGSLMRRALSFPSNNITPAFAIADYGFEDVARRVMRVTGI